MLNGIEVMIAYICGGLAIFWAIVNAVVIKTTKMPEVQAKDDEETALLKENNSKIILELSEKVSRGANSFLVEELQYLGPALMIFAAVVLIVLDIYGQKESKFRCYNTFAFLTGALASFVSTAISLKTAISANFRTAIQARKSLNDGFNIAFRVGCVCGFTSVGICLISLLSVMVLYDKVLNTDGILSKEDSFRIMADSITAFALGSTIVAFFGRIGGGLYTKASDVGADLIGKIEGDQSEALSTNVIMISDKLGDYIGSVVGMGSDLYDSLACTLSATLVIISHSPSLSNEAHLIYPFLIIAVGIVASFVTSFIGIHVHNLQQNSSVFFNLRIQLLITTILSIIGIGVVSFLYLPLNWTLYDKNYTWISAMICVSFGIIIGFFTEVLIDFFTQVTRNFSKRDHLDAEINQTYTNLMMIQFGYLATLIPIILVALVLFVSMMILGIYGLGLTTLGMFSTLPIGLSIDCFAPVCSNAKDMVEILAFSTDEIHSLNILNSAGKRFAYTRPAFSIAMAFLTSVLIYAAFVLRSVDNNVSPIMNLKISNPWIFCSILIGILVPYSFSALTIRSIGKVVEQMIDEFKNQFDLIRHSKPGYSPDFQKYIELSSRVSIYEIILPLVLTISIPVLLGVVFHPLLLYGFIPGAVLSAFQLAISISNTCGPWDNTKKMINSGTFVNLDKKKLFYRQSETKPTTLIGDTIGDSLKDSSGSSLNLLVKLLTIFSLVFVKVFTKTALFGKFLDIGSYK